MIELAGGITDRATFSAFCASPQRDAICNPLSEMPDLSAKVEELSNKDVEYRAALDRGGVSYRDPRVRAAFAIAPALGQAFPPKNLTPIRIPVEIVAGVADDICPVTTNAQCFAKHIRGVKITILPGGVGHFTFINACTDLG